MRILTAIVAIVLGAAALVAGIGQKTFWAPSETVTAAIPGSVEAAPLTVIESGVNDVNEDPIEITIKGDGEFLLALGRSSDVDAWVGDASVNRVTEVDTEERVLKTVHEGSEDEVPNPENSDLWVAKDTVDGETVYTWTEPAEGEWSLLVAADGSDPAPTDISVEWPNNATTPFALGLIIIGALLVLFGLLRLVWPSKKTGNGARAANDDTREVPQVKGSNRGVAKRLTAVGAMVALTFSGVTAAHATEESEPSDASASADAPEDTDGDSDAYPVLLEMQLERILSGVSRAIEAGDEDLDAGLLEARLGGDALSDRRSNYKQISDEVDGVKLLEPVVAGPVRTSAVTTTTDWPRTVLAVTGEESPRILTLTQKDPRSNYKLTQNVEMLAGTSFPGIVIGDTSIRTLDLSDGSGLQTDPADATVQLRRFLNNPEVSEKDMFAESQYIEAVHKAQNEAKKEAEDEATVEYKRFIDEDSIHAVSTPDGGALVTLSIESVMITAPREEGATVTWGKNKKHVDLAGADETTGTANFSYAESFALYIPAAGSDDKIQVIAADSELQKIDIDE
ncbi:hypothetical protein [Zhihengliuella halotolerans]|uniref:Uncharacterized protein n=1 Tax=Zhihengliuella halotolerans TaxID=370736 RepID=A0A4Q8ABU6_9MICC|nr:hypothetical protein [Zhihengliuella halotolerans]RZU61657.1 hypothetical protein EV380_1233 [Zhihengliuella halotolerans]